MTTSTLRCSLALCLVLGALLAPPTSARPRQEPDPAAAGAAQEPASGPALGQRVTDLRAELARWGALADARAGEDEEVAHDQLRRVREELDDELDALAESEDAAARQLASGVTRERVDALWAEHVALDEELAGLRGAPPDDLGPGELAEALDELEREQTGVLGALTAHVARLATLEHGEAAQQSERLVAELEDRAEMAVARLELRVAKIDRLRERLERAPDDRKAELEQSIAALERLRDAASDSFARISANLAALGVEVDAELKNARLEATRELVVEDLDAAVIGGVVQRWLGDTRETVMESLPQWLFRAFLFFGVLAVFYGIARIVRRLVRSAVGSARLNLSKLLREFFVNLAGKLVLFLGLLIALSQLGFELGPVLAGLGIAGFVIGFALQDTLSNFASGLMILIYRPFDVGDAVSVAGVTGKVHEMTLVSTTILTFDNQEVVVPNTKIWGDVITNITARSTRRVDMTFGIGYADDIPRAEEILTEVVAAHPKVLADPAPTVKLASLGESSVNFVVRPWANTVDYWDVLFDVTRTVKLRFDEEGVSIPFPQRDVHLHYVGREEERDRRTLVPAGTPPADLKPVEELAPATATYDVDEGRS